MRTWINLLIVLLIISPCQGFDGDSWVIIGPSVTACTEGTTTDICTTSNGQSNMDASADGTVFVASGSYSEYGASFRLNVASGSGVVEVRVGNSTDLSTYTARMQITVTNTNTASYVAGQWLESDLATPKRVDYVDTNTYYIGIVQVSGDTVRWQRDAVSEPCANQSGRTATSDGWNMNNSTIIDWNWKSVRCA
jgi:hypothetical protein